VAITPGDDTRGIARPDRLGRLFTLERFAAAPPLDRFVDHFWTASWDLPEGQSHDQKVVTHPVVNLVFENGRGSLSGVITETFVRELAGQGKTLAVMFRPGGFRPFLGRSMSTITDRTLDIAEVFGPEGTALARTIEVDDVGGSITRVSAFLADLAPTEPTRGEQVSSIVELVASDPAVESVAALADRLGVHPRRLQRLFADHVGVSPRWVIQRARLHAAAEEVTRTDRRSWAELAAALGYSDQAHLTRRFKDALGDPPARYADRVDQRRED
jgi:AraC-like DNA-binding protein